MPAALTVKPVIASISCQDSSGCAGLSADIETFFSLGCHCAPITSAITARDTENIKDRQAVEAPLVIEQLRAVLEDYDVALIKLGDLGSVANAEAVHTVLSDYPSIPVVLDPDTKNHVEDGDMLEAIRMLLLPLTTITILSTREIQRLAPGGDSTAASAQSLIQYDCNHILITEVAGAAQQFCNQLYSLKGLAKSYPTPPPSNRCHGAGTTLSAAIAAYLAHGFSMYEAVKEGQAFAQTALEQGLRLGMGRLVPNRMHWSDSNR